MMWTPFRSPKIYGFILGFQRWVWWPKCAPTSSNCCMVTSDDAMIILLPVKPLRCREAGCPATGMMAPHVGCAGTYLRECAKSRLDSYGTYGEHMGCHSGNAAAHGTGPCGQVRG